MTDLPLPGGLHASSPSSSLPNSRLPKSPGRNRLATASVICIALFFAALLSAIILHPKIPDLLLVTLAALPIAAVVLGVLSRRKPHAVGRRRAHGAVTAGVVILVLILGVTIFLPSLCRPREGALVAKCSSNLKNICAGLYMYADAHHGEYPPSLDALVTNGMTPAVLVCPASNDSMATGNSTEEVLKNLHEETFHQSYVYIRPTPATLAANGVMVYEHPHNHRHTHLNVLFCNGEVRLLDKTEALALIPELAKELDAPYGDR